MSDLPPQSLRMQPGDAQRHPLPNHGGGGYRWHCEVEGTCVRATIDPADPDEPTAVPGSRVGQVVTVVAVEPGTAAVLLQERRSWEATAAATARVAIDVVPPTVPAARRGRSSGVPAPGNQPAPENQHDKPAIEEEPCPPARA